METSSSVPYEVVFCSRDTKEEYGENGRDDPAYDKRLAIRAYGNNPACLQYVND
jgi:hypothetical protein